MTQQYLVKYSSQCQFHRGRTQSPTYLDAREQGNVIVAFHEDVVGSDQAAQLGPGCRQLTPVEPDPVHVPDARPQGARPAKGVVRGVALPVGNAPGLIIDAINARHGACQCQRHGLFRTRWIVHEVEKALGVGKATVR